MLSFIQDKVLKERFPKTAMVKGVKEIEEEKLNKQTRGNASPSNPSHPPITMRPRWHSQSGHKLIDKQGVVHFPCSWRWRKPELSTHRPP